MTTPVSLTNCDREPIDGPGSIQPHGAMLVCDPETHKIVFASRNAADLTGCAGKTIHGAELQDVIGDRSAHEVRNAAAKAGASGVPGIVLGLTLRGVSGTFDVAAHVHRRMLFVEIEPSGDGDLRAREALDFTRSLIQRIGRETGLDAIVNTGARLLRALLDYDRVMVCRFLHNGAGRVIAEAKAPGLGSFLGQHFPASDIPPQARRLHLLNPVRMIGDTGCEPVPLDPPLAPGENPLDMSFAQLRSVSPIHRRYLRNMGVAASFSISVIVDGELWGLISCHHNSPKVLPMPLRVGAELFGQCFSLRIAVAERRAAMLAASRARARLDTIVAGLSGDCAIVQGLVGRLPEVASLAGASGAGLWMDGVWSTSGLALDHDAARALLRIAGQEAPHALWSTQELRRHLPQASSSCVAGVLAIPLSMTMGDYLVLFRNEEAHDVQWAGEPAKPGESTPSGDIRLSPRGSFETWREEVRGRSAPWTDDDLAVAEEIGTYLRDVILRQNEASSEERARLEQRRRILNDELNHRVKNIISLVKSIAAQSSAGATSVEEYSASLEGRLRALSIAHDQSLGGVDGGDLGTLVETETGLYRDAQAPDRIAVEGPPLRLDERAFGVMALVLHELMTNAVKYGALSVPEGRLRIVWAVLPDGRCELRWTESNGPPVRRPRRAGFGTRLISSAMEYDLRGGAELTYATSGLSARFLIPAAHIAPGEPVARVAEQAEAVPGTALAGRSILVVEDQGLIALDAEDTLRRLGASDIRLTPSAEDAIRELETFSPDAAVLDFNLGSGTSESVADILAARAVPFVFTTGYTDRFMIPERFRHVPLVRKPISAAAVATQIALASHMKSGETEEREGT